MSMPPMILKLIIVNAALSVVFMILRQAQPELAGTIGDLVLLTPRDATLGLHLWQIATYMWIHVSPMQLLLNLLMLWMFGAQFEPRWGSRSLLKFFVFSGIIAGGIAALVGSVMGYFNVPNSGMGAALNALLMAFAMSFPEQTINFYFLIPIKGRQLVYIVVLIEVVLAAAGMNYMLPAQLGGLAAGWLLITGKWRPSRWGLGIKAGGSRPKRPNPGNLRVVKPSKDDDDEEPPKYLN